MSKRQHDISIIIMVLILTLNRHQRAKRFLSTPGLLEQAVHRDAWELTLRSDEGKRGIVDLCQPIDQCLYKSTLNKSKVSLNII